VRPHAHDRPTIAAKPCIGISVTSLIRDDLFTPKLRIPLRPRRVRRATMPKATIDENGNARATECNVRNPAGLGQHRNVQAISETEGV
jgi:hypothetical protein